jgi:hypothetical protein
MSIVQAIVAARSQMAALVADETAKIATNKGGEYKFKYVSLSQIIETVTPALLEHGVLLVQDIGNVEERADYVSVMTKLLGDSETISSMRLWFKTDGTPKDVGMKVTTGRRIQLMALLGMAVSDEDDTPAAKPTTAWKPVSLPPLKEPEPIGMKVTPEHQRAAKLSNDLRGVSPTLSGLVARIQADDQDEAPDMPVKPQEGKTMSMYGYLTSLVSHKAEPVLSYLYGRVITQDTPPTMATRWLIDELRSGKYDDVVDEVRKHLGDAA